MTLNSLYIRTTEKTLIRDLGIILVSLIFRRHNLFFIKSFLLLLVFICVRILRLLYETFLTTSRFCILISFSTYLLQ